MLCGKPRCSDVLLGNLRLGGRYRFGQGSPSAHRGTHRYASPTGETQASEFGEPVSADRSSASPSRSGIASGSTSSARLRLVVAGRQDVPDDADGQPGGVPLAGQHADQAPEHRRRAGPAHRRAACARPAPGRSPPRSRRRPRSSAAPTSSSSTPRRRSSPASARRASPLPWCRLVDPGLANGGVVDQPDLVEPVEHLGRHARPATPRLRSVAASSARVRGRTASCCRQMSRATWAGSRPGRLLVPGCGSAGRPGARRSRPRPASTVERRASPAPAGRSPGPAERVGGGIPAPPRPRATSASGHGQKSTGRPRARRRRRPRTGADAELLLDLLLDLVGEVGVVRRKLRAFSLPWPSWSPS